GTERINEGCGLPLRKSHQGHLFPWKSPGTQIQISPARVQRLYVRIRTFNAVIYDSPGGVGRASLIAGICQQNHGTKQIWISIAVRCCSECKCSLTLTGSLIISAMTRPGLTP